MYMEGILILLSVDNILAFNILWLLINLSVLSVKSFIDLGIITFFVALQQQTCKGCKIIIIVIVINTLVGKCLES